VNNISDYAGFGLCRPFGIHPNTTFRKLDLFPSSDEGWETPILFVRYKELTPSLLECWMMEKVQLLRLDKMVNENRDFVKSPQILLLTWIVL
jgi:hypothetical protein